MKTSKLHRKHVKKPMKSAGVSKVAAKKAQSSNSSLPSHTGLLCQVCNKVSRHSLSSRGLQIRPEANGAPTVTRTSSIVCEACKKFSSRFSSRLSSLKDNCEDLVSKCVCKFSADGDGKPLDLCRWCRFRRCQALGLTIDRVALKEPINLNQVPCSVCSAPSSGYHFGVISCESCKGFYRRTIRQNLESTYTCESSNSALGHPCNVTISEPGRKCKKCRFLKCTTVGMSPTSSWTGRHSYQLRAETKALLARLQAAPKEEPTDCQTLASCCNSSTSSTPLSQTHFVLPKVEPLDIDLPIETPPDLYDDSDIFQQLPSYAIAFESPATSTQCDDLILPDDQNALNIFEDSFLLTPVSPQSANSFDFDYK